MAVSVWMADRLQWWKAASKGYLLACVVCLLRGGRKAPACGTYKTKIENTTLGGTQAQDGGQDDFIYSTDISPDPALCPWKCE